MVKQFRTRVARVAHLLNHHQVRYVVIGAEACNVHGVVRGTKDVDILLEKTLPNVERALTALGELTWGLAKELDASDIIKKPFTIIGDDPRVDLLFVAGRLKFSDMIGGAETFTIEDIPIPFANLAQLIESKRTDRAKDIADLEVLEQIQKSGKPQA